MSQLTGSFKNVKFDAKNEALYSYILIGANMDQALAKEFLEPAFPHVEKLSSK